MRRGLFPGSLLEPASLYWHGLVGRTFESLSVRNYRLYFLGQVISVGGVWMRSTAQMWLVYRLTHNGVALGVTAALQFGPMLFLGVWGGVLADRLDKRTVLLVTQTSSGLLVGGLALLTLSGHVTLWAVYAFALILGLINAIDNPVRQSFVSEMVGSRLVPNAVSLNSTVFTSARMVGPAAAGAVIAAVGTGWCFAYNAVSYVAVLVALLRMRPEEFHRAPMRARSGSQVLQGLRYAWRAPELRLPLLLMAVIGTLSFNFSVLLPLVATRVFHGGPATYGLLFSSMGVGSLIGALLSAGRARPTMGVLTGAALAFGILLMVAAAMPALWMELGGLAVMGAAMTTYQATSNSSLQLNSRPELRGRVIALYLAVFAGTAPIGGPTIGWVAQTFGPRAAMAMGGGVAVLAALVAILWWRMRRAEPPEGERRREPAPVVTAERAVKS